MDVRAVALLNAQDGVLGAVQLARLALTPTDARRWVAAGDLVRLRRGAFVDAGRWREADADERYRLTVMAVMRARTARDIATHHSALALHRLPLWHVDRRLVVLSSDVQETTSANGLRLMRLRSMASPTDVSGLEALSIPDAVVTTSSVDVEAGVVAADAAVHQRWCSVAELAEAAERLLPTLRGRARVRRALASIDGAAESPGESRTRLVLSAAGLPVESQVPIRDADGELIGRVDFLVAGRVIVEFDGAVKYGAADGAQALFAEKRREDRLREAGYAVVRVTWDELGRPGLIVNRVRRALLRAIA